jgi:ABC-type nitrate/sulfonate/bicarbonate transport system substrate-binding protein
VVLITNTEKLRERADVYKRFMDATRRGYEFAAQDPQGAAQLFLNYPDLRDLFPEPEMVRRSADKLAPFLVNDGVWGRQASEKWEAYVNWLVGSGVVTDEQNQPITSLRGQIFTNALQANQAARGD